MADEQGPSDRGTDEHGSSDGAANGQEAPDDAASLPIDRRNFLQLGLAGAAFDHESVEQYVTGDARDSAVESVVATGRTQSIATPQSRAFLPIVTQPVSVRSLPSQDPRFDPRLPDGRLSLQRRAFPLQYEPLSVRELVTPQTSGETTNAMPTSWENWLGNQNVDTAYDLEIDSHPQRRRLVEHVNVYDTLSFRAVGSGHSHSEAAKPETYFSDLKEVTGLLPTDWIRDADSQFWDDHDIDRSKLVRVKAGTVLKKLNRDLLQGVGLDNPDLLPAEGLALQNMGSWDGQTLGGAINTGTHGTGLGLGTFADLVRSVEIVSVPESQIAPGRAHVRMLRVEPSDGVTDPETFALNAGDHYSGLVQDDDLFHSVVVGYGAMGFAYSYILELREPYWLREKNQPRRWGSFDPVQWAESNRHFNFLVDLIEPQLNGTNNPTCLLRTRNPTPAPDRDPTERANVANATEQIMNDFLDSWKDIDDIQDVVNSIGESYETILSIDALDPAGYDPPFVGGYDESIWYIALRRKKDNHPNRIPPEPPQDAITTEVGVPVSQVKPAVNRVIQFVKNNDRFFPAPLGVRFTAGSEHYFAAEYGRKTAMLEFIIPQPEKLQQNIESVKIKKTDNPLKIGKIYTKPKKIFYQKLKKIAHETDRLGHFLQVSEAREELAKVQRELVHAFDGRPHMGKFNTVNVASSHPYMRPQNMYPEYGKWRDTHRYLSAFDTFDNDFTENKVGD